MSDAVLTTVATDDSGVIPESLVAVDFFSFKETKEVELRGSGQFVTIKKFTEGDRRKYMNTTSREVKFAQSGQTSMDLRPGDDRRALLEIAISGWSVQRNGRPLEFTPRNLGTFLDSVDPSLVDEIEDAVRDYNPWLLNDVTIEDIDAQIAELESLRKRKVIEAEGKAD